VDLFEYINELSGFIKDGEFLYQLSDYKFLREDSVPGKWPTDLTYLSKYAY
jgi:hypothetical protein